VWSRYNKTRATGSLLSIKSTKYNKRTLPADRRPILEATPAARLQNPSHRSRPCGDPYCLDAISFFFLSSYSVKQVVLSTSFLGGYQHRDRMRNCRRNDCPTLDHLEFDRLNREKEYSRLEHMKNRNAG
jgi:hypothetical protein